MTQTLARDLVTLVFGVPVLFQLIVGVLAAAMLRARNQRTLGPLLAANRPGRALRRGGASLLLCALFATVLLAHPSARVVEFAGLLLLPSLALVWLVAGAQDTLLGESGVQHGWHSRRFEDLEVWRLAGAELQFRLQGEWVGVPCPVQHESRLRARLDPRREESGRTYCAS